MNDTKTDILTVSRKVTLTLTAKAIAIYETLVIIEKIDSERNFMIFSGSASMLKGFSNSSTMNNTSHFTQMLKVKIERLELGGKFSILLISGELRNCS
jgi:hypothetical protein